MDWFSVKHCPIDNILNKYFDEFYLMYTYMLILTYYIAFR